MLTTAEFDCFAYECLVNETPWVAEPFVTISRIPSAETYEHGSFA